MNEQARTEQAADAEARFCDAFGARPEFAVVMVNGERQTREMVTREELDLADAGFASALKVRGAIEIRWPERGLRCVAEHISEIGVTYSIAYEPTFGDLGKSIRRLVRKGLRHGWGHKKPVTSGRGPIPSAAKLEVG